MQSSNSATTKLAAQTPSVALLITSCFFLSGLAGLIYEVVWARQLSLFLGITSYAHTAVITAYMAGLAAGSFYFGRRADKINQPLRLYAWLEIGVGLYAAMTPWLFDLLQLGYVSISDISHIGDMSGYLTRFIIALFALLIPTFLMGGTLPLLVRGFITELPDLGKITGGLYGINTLGAVLGTLLAGYLLIPMTGITATIFVGVIINLAVAVIVLTVLKKHHHSIDIHEPESVTVMQTFSTVEVAQAIPDEVMPARLRYVVIIGFAMAGFAALLTQLAWIRALILVVGGSVYAFTITLASFLVGIGLGSLLFNRFLAHPKSWVASSWIGKPMTLAALLAFLISLALFLGLPIIGKLPQWFFNGYAIGLENHFGLYQLFIFSLCFSVMIIPTLCMGALFPLIATILTKNFTHAGRGVGTAYAVNTIGSILGASLGGLFILPWLGIHNTIQLSAGLYFLVALVFWFSPNTSVSQIQRYAISLTATLIVIATAWLLPPWNKALMVSGVFYSAHNAATTLSHISLEQLISPNKLLYYREGLDGIVAVRGFGTSRSLVINGKPDASNKADLSTQVLLAQLPMAMDRTIENALVIGLGSGITAGSLATSESLKQLTILEISEEVVEASEFFSAENYNVLRDPRTRLVTADARNYLMAAPDRYDVIISEPSNPWISGISNLFTDEFIKLAKSRLNDGGLFTQWFHTYSMSNSDLKSMLKTLDENFRYVSVWKLVTGDLAIIGSDQPHALSLQYDIDWRAKELERADITRTSDLIKLYISGGDTLSRYVGNAEINSDNNPVIEFNSPRNMYALTGEQNFMDMYAYVDTRKLPVPVSKMVQQVNGYLDVRFMGLRIGPGDAQFSIVIPNWLLERQFLGKDYEEKYGVRDERILTWRESMSNFHLKAVWLKDVSPGNSLLKLLETTQSRTGRRAGNTLLSGDVDAVWLADTKAGNTKLTLDIAWDCKAEPSGFTRYALRATLPNPGEEEWENALEKLAKRISCYSPVN
jgi:spermidine synthase